MVVAAGHLVRRRGGSVRRRRLERQQAEIYRLRRWHDRPRQFRRRCAGKSPWCSASLALDHIEYLTRHRTWTGADKRHHYRASPAMRSFPIVATDQLLTRSTADLAPHHRRGPSTRPPPKTAASQLFPDRGKAMNSLLLFMILLAPFALGAALCAFLPPIATQPNERDRDAPRLEHDLNAVRTRFERQPSWPSAEARGGPTMILAGRCRFWFRPLRQGRKGRDRLIF